MDGTSRHVISNPAGSLVAKNGCGGLFFTERRAGVRVLSSDECVGQQSPTRVAGRPLSGGWFMPKDPPQRPKKPGVKYDLTTCACLVLSCFDFQQRVASTWLRGPRRLEAMMQLSEMGEDEGLLGQGACHLRW